MSDLSEEARLAGIDAASTPQPEPEAGPGIETAGEGPQEASCRRCGKVERIHPLDFKMCDDCRALGFGSNAAGEKLRFTPDESDPQKFEVLSEW